MICSLIMNGKNIPSLCSPRTKVFTKTLANYKLISPCLFHGEMLTKQYLLPPIKVDDIYIITLLLIKY